MDRIFSTLFGERSTRVVFKEFAKKLLRGDVRSGTSSLARERTAGTTIGSRAKGVSDAVCQVVYRPMARAIEVAGRVGDSSPIMASPLIGTSDRCQRRIYLT